MARKALLIIDMQKGSFTPKTPRFDTLGVLSRINTLASQFRKRHFPVIHIQHDGTKDSEFIPGTYEHELLDGLTTHDEDYFIDKYANDAFYKSKLQSILKVLEVETLYITGCATDFCIEATVQSALTKDYNITVVADAHTTGERQHVSAKQIILHYNWVWQNMINTKGTLKVEDFKTISTSL
ncbi:isochorismatase family protein [Tamlana fucoidanivorans]|uniref:Isochorismatase family protein n=1 Tax=Allotamlana fucoidanivorans TaxID=2583814 RepID=A0A5C4SDA8_9FLAO|nr:isochorismatase family protein [Tamlana fucoidanivorans]TNJ41212.1 isochorismatase family protein [Tamlana fucoidanivorans]